MTKTLSYADAVSVFLPEKIVQQAIARYDEPWRFYHNRSHFDDLIARLSMASKDGVEIHDGIAAIGFCAWHDSIYDPQAAHGRNEVLSALLCDTQMPLIAPMQSVHASRTTILSTVGHWLPDPDDSPDGALLLDVDLSVLGADQQAFDNYDANIQMEYSHVGELKYRQGRIKVLETFLTRDRLFLTEWAHAKWESAARENLTRTIERLKIKPD